MVTRRSIGNIVQLMRVMGVMRVGSSVALCALAFACRSSDVKPVSASGGEAAEPRIVVDRPTVVAYFVIPAGAVDTMPDLAVEADDWNFAMASLGERLEADSVAFAIMTDPRVTLAIRGRGDTTVALGAFRDAGYVYARPGASADRQPGAAEADSIVARARLRK